MSAPAPAPLRRATGSPGLRVDSLVLDTSDLERATRFWSGLLGVGVARGTHEWVDLEAVEGGGLVLSLQLVPEAKVVKNRMHLDLAAPDVVAQGERATGLGATPAGPLQDPDGSPWRVWRDPEGNEFCLVTA